MFILLAILILGVLFAPFKKIVGLFLLSLFITIFFSYQLLYQNIIESLLAVISMANINFLNKKRCIKL
jgi:putative flippase GtrA